MQKLPFSELGLSESTLKAVEKLGFEQTSPIQSAAIPLLMAGKDIVGQSATGSGKTAAFAIPGIERVKDTDRKPQILVLVPTRELATQVAEEFSRLSAFRPKVHAVPIYGGASYERQFSELRKGPQIVIGTPGRIIDHLQRNTLDLSEVKMAVLDECDRMLDMGFREDMERILSAAPKERQTVFFSATLPPPIKRLIETFSRQPEHVKIEGQAMTVPTVEQIFFDVPPRAKLDALCRLLDIHDARLSIVFANTQRTVDEITDALLARGYAADRLHGGISQALRTRTMGKFKRSEFEILVATDVAGRGLDVDDLDLVVNYDLPYDPEDYVHRIGRTGRAGRKGVAMTLVSGREVYRLQHVERFTRQRIRRGRVPTWDQVEEKRLSEVLDKVRATLEDGKHAAHGIYIDRLLDEGHAATELAAALLHQLLAAEGIESDKKPEADPFAQRGPVPATPSPAPAPAKPVPAGKKPAKDKPLPAAATPEAPIQAIPAPSPAPESPAARPQAVPERIEALVGKAPAPSKTSESHFEETEPPPQVAKGKSVSENATSVVGNATTVLENAPGDVENAKTDAGIDAGEAKKAPVSASAGENDAQNDTQAAEKAARKAAKRAAYEEAKRLAEAEAAREAPVGEEDPDDEEEVTEEEEEESDDDAQAHKVPVKKSAKAEKKFELPAPANGYKWITMSAGKEDGLAPRDVVDAITEGGDFEGKDVGLIIIEDAQTHVQVKTTVAAAVIEALTGATLGDKELTLHFPRAAASARAQRAERDRPERPAYRRDDDRPRRDDDRPRGDYGGFRKPDGPYAKKPFGYGPKPGGFAKKPGGFGGKPGGFRKDYGNRDDRPAGFRKDYGNRDEGAGGYRKDYGARDDRPAGFARKPGGFYKKPGGYGGPGGSYDKKPGGFRKEGGSAGPRPGGFRKYGETQSGDTRSWRKEDDRPREDRPGPPRKGPGRW